jgi:hypothetical protein
MYEVSISPEQRKRVEDALSGRDARKALSSAVKKTAATAKVRLAKVIGEELALPQGEIKAHIKVRPVKEGDLTATLTLKRTKISLIKFGARGLSRGGVSVRVSRKKGIEHHPHWFIATMPTGHRGVFTRETGKPPRYVVREKNGKKYRSQLPIREVLGPTPLGVFTAKPGLAETALKEIGEVLEKNVLSQLDRFLRPR